MSEELARKLIEDCGGTVKEVSGPLPDGSGFMIGSFPLRKDHWIYQGTNEDILNGYIRHESYGDFNVPPMIFRMGSKDKAVLVIGQPDDDPNADAGIPIGRGVTMTKQGFAEAIKTAGRYAVRCATMNGKEMDFDPDALLQNLVVGFLGYWTEDGRSSDEFDNPKLAYLPGK